MRQARGQFRRDVAGPVVQTGEQILECVTDVALFSLTGDAIPLDGETIEITRGSVRVRRMPSLRNDGAIALRVRV